MKGFKSTGNGPKYGSFAFPSKAGFGPSSGKVKSISGYTRRAAKRPKRLAVGGLAEDGIVEAPGFSDYAEGGKVKGVSDPMSAKEAMGHARGGALRKVTGAAITKAEAAKVREKGMKNLKKVTGAQVTDAEAKRMGYAKGGQVSAAKAKQIAQGVVKDHVNYPAPKGHKGFNRNAVIGK